MGVHPSVGAVLLSLLLTGLAVPGRHDRLIQDAALPHPAHRRPARPQRTPPPAPHRCQLALGQRHRHRLDSHQRPRPGILTRTNPSRRPRKGLPGPVEPPAEPFLLPSRLIPHRHRPRAELQPAHELQVDMLR